jgi:Tol biopolymer transport system component
VIATSATYDSDFRKRRTNIYLMDDDGQNMRCLTARHHLAIYHRLYWLADYKSVLFTSYIPTEQFYIIDIDSAVVRPFMRENEQKFINQITYDQKIFFSTHGHDWVVPINGTLDDRIELVVEGMLVAVSPDGQWIAFYKKETPRFVYLQKLNTAEVQKISMSYGEHVGDGRSVVWSSDARYLAYQAGYDDLWVMRADGTQRRHVGELNYFWSSFRWSPDSASIAFIGPVRADQGGGPGVSAAPLLVTAIDNPAPQHLATLHRHDGSGGSWAWMPDSQHIVYATHEHDVSSLYKINIQSGEQHLLTDPGHPFAAIYDVAVSRRRQ